MTLVRGKVLPPLYSTFCLQLLLGNLTGRRWYTKRVADPSLSQFRFTLHRISPRDKLDPKYIESNHVSGCRLRNQTGIAFNTGKTYWCPREPLQSTVHEQKKRLLWSMQCDKQICVWKC